MCYDLNEYNPFGIHAETEYGAEEEIYSELMTKDDWMEWLEIDQ